MVDMFPGDRSKTVNKSTSPINTDFFLLPFKKTYLLNSGSIVYRCKQIGQNVTKGRSI
ncbi:MAG TPA: hypothetical protein VK203_14320 [Nostocaceae cyanobacterium]|nr:hypothetical protein [Nostocaceae cyanobacterium]